MKDPWVNAFLRTVFKAKFVLNSHLVEEPTDSTVCGSQNMELTWGCLGNNPKDRTFNQDKQVFLCV